MSITSNTIQGFINNDNEAITQVYLEYKNLIYFVIANYVDNKEDCNDVLSDVFLKAIEHRNDVKKAESLKSFLCTIAKNEAINFSKKNRLVPSSDVIEDVYGENDEPDSIRCSFSRSQSGRVSGRGSTMRFIRLPTSLRMAVELSPAFFIFSVVL